MLQVMAAAAPGEPPWEQPCKYELQVALERLVASEHLLGGDSAVSMMFLLDGSGSVTEGMVKTMVMLRGHCSLLRTSCMCSRPGRPIVVTCSMLQCRRLSYNDRFHWLSAQQPSSKPSSSAGATCSCSHMCGVCRA